jgi:hypothetical protein
MNIPNINTNTNLYGSNRDLTSSLKMPRTFIPFIVLIVFLIIIMFLIFFKVNLIPSSIKIESKSDQQSIYDIFIIVFFCLIITILCFILLPNFQEIRTLFGQISNVLYVILYTIFLILFFTLMPKENIDTYANIIVPIVIFLGVVSFYKSVSTDYTAIFNVNYERIKMMIISFCLITCYIIFYNTDPGNIISTYFGSTSLFTILTLVFAFLYTLTLLTVPDQGRPTPGSANLLSKFSNFSVIGSLLFIVFIITMVFLIYKYPGGFLQDKPTSAAVIILLLIIGSLWSMLLISNLFPELTNKSITLNKMSLFKRALLALFGLIMSGILIYWLTINVQNLSGQSGIISFVLNTILVLIFLGLIYKAINVTTPSGNSKKSGFVNLIINTILYIPCLFTGSFDSIGKAAVGEYKATTASSFMMLGVAVGIFALYFTCPYLFNTISNQGGKQLVNKPVNTNTLYNLGTYQDLNGSDDYDYQFAISCWIYIEAVPPNTNASYETYTSLLNFGNKPNILYNGQTNTIMITTQQKDLQENTENVNLTFDENGNRIVYTMDNVLLQKWNNFIINYNGGVLDIFLNGELVKSNIHVVPYYTLDSLTIGQDGGIQGGICNVIYFKKPLTATNIYYLYNISKGKNPPTNNESNETIVQNNVKTLSSSFNSTI